MKRLFCLAIAASALLVTGCTQENTPQGAAKAFVKEHVSFDERIHPNTNGMTYEVVQADENMAVIAVKGAVTYDGRIQVAKDEEGKWQVQ